MDYESLKIKYFEATTELEKQKSEYNKLQQKYTNAIEIPERKLRIQIQEMKEENEKLIQQLSEKPSLHYQQQLREMEQNNESLSMQLVNKEMDRLNAVSREQNYVYQIQELNKRLELQKNEVENSKTILETTVKKCKDIERENTMIKNNKMKEIEAIAQIQQKPDPEMQHKCEVLQIQLQTANQKLVYSQQEIEQLKTKSLNTPQFGRSQLSKQQYMEESLSQSHRSQADPVPYIREIDQQNLRIRQLESIIQQLQQQNQSLVSSKQQYQQSQQMQNLQSQQSQLQQQINQYQGSNYQKTPQRQNLQLSQQLQNNDQDSQRLVREIQNKQQLIDNMQTEVQNSQAQVYDIQAVLDVTQQELQEALNQKMIYENQCRENQIKAAEGDHRVRRLEQDIQKLIETNERQQDNFNQQISYQSQQVTNRPQMYRSQMTTSQISQDQNQNQKQNNLLMSQKVQDQNQELISKLQQSQKELQEQKMQNIEQKHQFQLQDLKIQQLSNQLQEQKKQSEQYQQLLQQKIEEKFTDKKAKPFVITSQNEKLASSQLRASSRSLRTMSIE